MNLLFTLFCTGAWISAALVLRSKNPVHAVFYLVLVFLHASGLLCLLGLEYFALLQLLVYVGALAIMFLFVVMLLDIPATEIVAYQRGTYPAAGILLLALFAAFWFSFINPNENSPWDLGVIPLTNMKEIPFYPDWANLAEASSPVAQLGVALYGVHVDLLILASLVLLVAIIGAVALTLKRRVQAPMHDIFAQHNRDFQKVICQIRSSSKFEFKKNYKLNYESIFSIFLMTQTSMKVRTSIWNQPLLSLVQNHLVSYPTPSNLTGNWNWGVLAGLCLVLQILTGIFLAMHYTAHVDLAFPSVQHLMRDVPSGWLLRYLHANGASLFFIVVYMHLFRGLYFTSYAQPRELVWLLGVVILLVMILTAFIGYVLPWGEHLPQTEFHMDAFYVPKILADMRIGPHNYDVVCFFHGVLLGDAYAEKHGNGIRICFHHSSKQASFLWWIVKFLAN